MSSELDELVVTECAARGLRKRCSSLPIASMLAIGDRRQPLSKGDDSAFVACLLAGGGCDGDTRGGAYLFFCESQRHLLQK